MFPILADFLSSLGEGTWGTGGGQILLCTLYLVYFHQVQTKVFLLKLLKPGSDLLK
jgi:hypothetical protein